MTFPFIWCFVHRIKQQDWNGIIHQPFPKGFGIFHLLRKQKKKSIKLRTLLKSEKYLLFMINYFVPHLFHTAVGGNVNPILLRKSCNFCNFSLTALILFCWQIQLRHLNDEPIILTLYLGFQHRLSSKAKRFSIS